MSRWLIVVLFVVLLAILSTLTSDVVFPDSLLVAASLIELLILTAILEKLDSENPSSEP